MILVAVLLLVTGGVVAAFLYPRSVTVQILLLNTTADQPDSGNSTCPKDGSYSNLVLEVKVHKWGICRGKVQVRIKLLII